jgi:predicted RNase H-like HicB family nuclease
MIYVYRIEIETDKETGEIVASIPTLNYTADFGGTVEEAIERLRELAIGFVETLIEEGEPIPPSDKLMGNDLYLSLEIEQRAKVA